MKLRWNRLLYALLLQMVMELVVIFYIFRQPCKVYQLAEEAPIPYLDAPKELLGRFLYFAPLSKMFIFLSLHQLDNRITPLQVFLILPIRFLLLVQLTSQIRIL